MCGVSEGTDRYVATRGEPKFQNSLNRECGKWKEEELRNTVLPLSKVLMF